MAFTESEKVQIRRVLGYSRLHLSSDPRLESAMSTVGDHIETSAMVTSAITAITTIESQLDECADAAMALKDGGSEVDFGYRFQIARARGRQLVGRVADALETHPVRDIFAPPKYGGGRYRGD